MAGAAGAQAAGSWFNGDGTWNLEEKLVVDGDVSWPSEFEITHDADTRVFTGNELPDHTTGEFPVSRATTSTRTTATRTLSASRR